MAGCICVEVINHRSGHDALDDFAADFGQAFLASEVHKAERVLIEPQLIKQSGVEVAEVDRVLSGFETDVVGGPVHGAAFKAAARYPHGKASVVMVAPVAFFGFG